MYPIEVHILREKTRPTNEEAQFLFDFALDSRYKQEGLKMLGEALKNGVMINFKTGNLTNPLMTIANSLDAFFQQNGGDRFLMDSDKYHVDTFSFGKMRSKFPISFKYEGYSNEADAQNLKKALESFNEQEEVGMVIVFAKNKKKKRFGLF